MKKILSAVCAGLMAVMLSGCTQVKFIEKIPADEYAVIQAEKLALATGLSVEEILSRMESESVDGSLDDDLSQSSESDSDSVSGQDAPESGTESEEEISDTGTESEAAGETSADDEAGKVSSGAVSEESVYPETSESEIQNQQTLSSSASASESDHTEQWGSGEGAGSEMTDTDESDAQQTSEAGGIFNSSGEASLETSSAAEESSASGSSEELMSEGTQSYLDDSGFEVQNKLCWMTKDADLYKNPKLEGITTAGLPKHAQVRQTGISADGKVVRIEASAGDVWYLNAQRVVYKDPLAVEVQSSQSQQNNPASSSAQSSPGTQSSQQSQTVAVPQSSANSRPAASVSSVTQQAVSATQGGTSSAPAASSASSSANTAASARPSVSSSSSASAPVSSSAASSVADSAAYANLPGVKIVYTPKEPDKRTGKDYDALIEGQKFVTVEIAAKCVYPHIVGNAPRAVTGITETADRVGELSTGQLVTVIAVGNNGWSKLKWENNVSAYVPTDALRRV